MKQIVKVENLDLENAAHRDAVNTALALKLMECSCKGSGGPTDDGDAACAVMEQINKQGCWVCLNVDGRSMLWECLIQEGHHCGDEYELSLSAYSPPVKNPRWAICLAALNFLGVTELEVIDEEKKS